jgi:hypothetical protein
MSTRQRLKASGWRGVEFGPVELLLNAVKSLFPDLATRAQPGAPCVVSSVVKPI